MKCPKCNTESQKNICPNCKTFIRGFEKQEVSLQRLLDEALRKTGVRNIEKVKGVKGLTSKFKQPEILEKGILRSKYGLYVYKDGTTRFDATDAPLSHFKPKEIKTSIETLKNLGYTLEDAREYAPIGCVEPAHTYKSFGCTNATQLNIVKCRINLEQWDRYVYKKGIWN